MVRKFALLLLSAIGVTILRVHCGPLRRNPEEGGYMEGDMMMESNIQLVTGLQMWKNGVIPYKYHKNFVGDDDDPGTFQVERAMNEFHKYTCIRFKEATDRDEDYIIIVNGTACASNVGRIGGRQEVRLKTPHCTQKLGIVIHELMHVLGIFHEQSRADRDQYIEILKDNIDDDQLNNFEIPEEPTPTYGIEYNFKSLMHYPVDAFSKNDSLNTIKVKNESIDTSKVGQRTNFSALDLEKIKRMYNCTNLEGLEFLKRNQ